MNFYQRRIIWYILGGIALFLLFAAISFYIYPIINPDADSLSLGLGGEEYLYDYVAFGPAAVAKLKKKITELESELEQRKTKEMRDIALIDSLYQVTVDLETQIASGQGFGGTSNNGLNKPINQQVEEIAKSLLRLDEDELAPIVNRLNDKLLVDLYESTSNIQREKLLRSLEPAKAAALLRRVMS